MRILILGGTRFLGRQVSETLAAMGHDLTLVSRRSTLLPPGIRHICAERRSGLAMLQGCNFDLVMDFICYDNEDVGLLMASIVAVRYVLISSTWLPRLWSGTRADELATKQPMTAVELPKATLNYLNGKLRAEQTLNNLRQVGCKAVALRLPIMLGNGDHTGRLDFYRRRLADGKPLIVAGGGQNCAQIAEMADLARVIVRWIAEADIERFPVWEALPGEGRSVRAIIETMAATAGVMPELVDVPLAELAQDLPIYLEYEPFWRESTLPLTTANIYAAVGMEPVDFSLISSTSPIADDTIACLRPKELSFLANRRAY